MGGLIPDAATDPDLLAGFDGADDAAVYRLSDDLALALTVDFFAPVVDDPFDYGYIAAANAMSDVYAVGGVPRLALNVAGFPRTLDASVVQQILRGGQQAVADAGALLVGGHTVDDAEPKYGLAVIGTVKPGEHVGHDGARPGDKVVLTKPLGSGVISTAIKAGSASDDEIAGAVRSMRQLNHGASAAMAVAGAHAATDITGYGLIGHLTNIADVSDVTIELTASDVPLLDGVERLADQSLSGGSQRNYDDLRGTTHWHHDVREMTRRLLCDAQTSGGLAIVVPADRLGALSAALQQHDTAGYVIGDVLGRGDHAITVRA